MSSLAQMSFGPSEPPYEEIGKKIPPMRTIFAMELASFTATAGMDSTYWGLTLRNVSCLPHDVRRAIFDGQEESSTTPIPTHVCDGRLYATGNEQEKGFDPNQVADCGLGKEDPCLCLTLKDCEWQPGSGDLPGGCAATANPGVSCQACPFQDKCVEPTQSEMCRLASTGCDCAFTKATSNGYGCAWLSGTCVSRSTADSAATSCDACATQVRCGTPVLYTITPNAGTLMGEMGVWSVQVFFDRDIYTQFKVDDTGIAMRCNTWEPTGGTVYRLGSHKLAVRNNILEIDLRNVVSDKRKTCVLSIAANVLRSVQSNLPYGGINDGGYFVFLPDTEEPTVTGYHPANSARDLGREVEVSFSFSEPIFPSREPLAHRVELYLTGNVANAGELQETIEFADERVSLRDDLFKVKLTHLEPSKFYSVVLPALSLNDAAGNNFTGIPRNFYIFGTGSDPTVDDVNWSDTLFIVLGVALVAIVVGITGVVGYLIMNSGRQNARIFAKQVRTKSKGATEADPMRLEDLDDGFYTQKPAVDARAEGSTAVEMFRQQHHVTVAWDASKPAIGLEHSSSNLSASYGSHGHVSHGLGSHGLGSHGLNGGHSSHGLHGDYSSHHTQLQARSVSPHNSPRPSASPRPGVSPRPGALTDEGFGSRSGSQVAALYAQRGQGTQLALPGSMPKAGRSPSSKESPAGGRDPSKTLTKSSSKISVHSFHDGGSGSHAAPTKVQAPASQRARPRAPGDAPQAQMPSEPSPELSGVQKMLERGSSKMSLSGSFKGPLASGSTLAESAAVSRGMSKALRSNSRPLSRGQQVPVRRKEPH